MLRIRPSAFCRSIQYSISSVSINFISNILYKFSIPYIFSNCNNLGRLWNYLIIISFCNKIRVFETQMYILNHKMKMYGAQSISHKTDKKSESQDMYFSNLYFSKANIRQFETDMNFFTYYCGVTYVDNFDFFRPEMRPEANFIVFSSF